MKNNGGGRVAGSPVILLLNGCPYVFADNSYIWPLAGYYLIVDILID